MYPVNSYIPIRPATRKNIVEKDLDIRLKEMKYNEIINDLDQYFKNSYITNFDLIQNQCRGDKLNFSRKFYENISYAEVKKNLPGILEKKFISSAIRSERKDLSIEKELIREHFCAKYVEKKFESQGIFLSSMRKRFYSRKSTDDCKSLRY